MAILALVKSATDAPRSAKGLETMPAIALFCVAAGVAFWQSSRVTVLWDLTYVLEIAHRIAGGGVPYKEFVVPQPPLTFLIQAAIVRFMEPGFLWHRLYCAVVAGGTAALTWHVIVMQLNDARPRHRALIGAIAAVPTVFLNGYAILPLPFYDSDCSFLVLLALSAILAARRGTDWRTHFAAGVLIVLPVLAKQNIGLAALLLVHGFLLLSALGRGQRSEHRAYMSFAAGSMVSALLLGATLHAWIGLSSLYEWTVSYAASRRWPAGRLLLLPYLQTGTWIAIAAAFVGYYMTLSRGSRWRPPLGLAIIGLPMLVATPTILRWGLAARASYLWGLGGIAGSAGAIADCLRQNWRFESAVPLIAIGVAHAAFASQGVYDSAYGVWPFLMIALAPLAARLIDAAQSLRITVAFVVGLSAALTSLGYRHIARQERLGFVDLSGPVESASRPPIRGLAVPGTHVSDFERLIARTDELIPRDEGILAFPGEDPFFFVSGRHPRLPIVLFDDTAMPYDRTQLLRLLEEHDIKWVVLKDRLQLRHLPWRHLEAFVTTDLPARYQIIDVLPRYRILKLRSTAAPPLAAGPR